MKNLSMGLYCDKGEIFMDQIQKRRLIREKKQKRTRRILASVLILVIIIIGTIIVITACSTKSYETSDGFQEYAQKYFEENERTQEVGKLKTDVTYGIPLSNAIEYPVMKNQITNAKVADIVKTVKNEYSQQNAGKTKEDKVALLVDYDTYKTTREVVGMAVFKNQQKEDGRKMEDAGSSVDTYNFSTKTGTALVPNQIFEDNYRKFCSEYMTKYFDDKYGDKLVEEAAKETLSDKDTNFNKFVMTGSGVKFYFDKGKVVDPEEGVVAVDVSYDDLDGVIRDKIAERYLDPKKPMVALTYDDGPHGPTSNRILDCLEANGAVATFYELGQNIGLYPEVLKRQAKLGMEVGSHSWSHPNLNTLSPGKVKEQIDKTNGAIKKAIGRTATTFRPPYGNSNANVEKYSKAPIVLWSVDTLDWKSRNADSVEAVVKGVKNLDGKVVLMHSIYDSTAEATERLVPWLIQEGYQLVTVDELTQYKYKETPKDGKLYGYNYFYLDNKK